jgi:hypothetical protein
MSAVVFFAVGHSCVSFAARLRDTAARSFLRLCFCFLMRMRPSKFRIFAFAALGFPGLAGGRVALFPPRHCSAVRAAEKAEMELDPNN